jgi:guanine deaminase
MYDEKFMRRAIELSAQAIGQDGAKPYGAIVVLDGKIVGEGLNQSAKTYDPTSHGEVEAVRDACRNLKTQDLSGAELYTSCEPCSVCVATMIIVGIGKMYYGATLDQSGSVMPTRKMPPPAHVVRVQVGAPTQKRDMLAAETKLGDEAVAVLKQWVAKNT